jgi:uncharacterized protein YrrD
MAALAQSPSITMKVEIVLARPVVDRLPGFIYPTYGITVMERPNSKELLRSALANRVVIDLQTAEELGRITQVLVDVRSQQVAGLVCGGGVLQRGGQTFLWEQVNSVGRDGVVIRAGAPTPEGKQALAEAIPLAELELWSDHGDRIGLLSDFGFEPHSGQILHYRFIADAASGFEPGLYQFSPEAVVSTGRRRMMADEQVLRQATLLEAGVQTPPQDARREMFGYDIPDPRQGWETAVEGTRELREQFGGQFQERGEKLRTEAQERFSGFLGNVKKRTRRLRNQMRETVTDLTAGLPAGQRLDDDDVKTIEVDSTELWSRENEETT